MKPLKIIATHVSARDHGPDDVLVQCDGCEFRAQIPRGSGEAFARSLGSELRFARAQITDHPTAPSATLTLDTRNGDGTHIGPVAADFAEDFGSYEDAKGFARYLGFKKATIVRMRDLPATTHKGRPRLQPNGQPFRAMLPAEETL
jgi:hypothetical protein